jgi:deoxyribonuclease I
MRWLLAIFSLVVLSSVSYAEPPENFSKAKRLLERQVYKHEADRVTFYCGCSYSRKKNVKPDTCGYQVRKNAKRGVRIEWEHVVPASRFGNYRQCWKVGDAQCVNSKGKSYKGRKCCKKVDAQFRMMEADLHNLVPAVGELNGDRSNYRMTVLKGEPRNYGQCDFEISHRLKLVEPAEGIRGDVARTYLYMNQQYGMSLTDDEVEMFNEWNSVDPVSEWEIERNRRISDIQGNNNSFVK